MDCLLNKCYKSGSWILANKPCSYIRELTQRVETLERERKGPREDGSPASPAPIPSSDVAFFGLSGGLPDLQGSPSGFQGPLSGYPQTGIKRVLSLVRQIPNFLINSRRYLGSIANLDVLAQELRSEIVVSSFALLFYSDFHRQTVISFY